MTLIAEAKLNREAAYQGGPAVLKITSISAPAAAAVQTTDRVSRFMALSIADANLEPT
jgi:hypothetical protein